jgi:hypothetical protein
MPGPMSGGRYPIGIIPLCKGILRSGAILDGCPNRPTLALPRQSPTCAASASAPSSSNARGSTAIIKRASNLTRSGCPTSYMPSTSPSIGVSSARNAAHAKSRRTYAGMISWRAETGRSRFWINGRAARPVNVMPDWRKLNASGMGRAEAGYIRSAHRFGA